MCENGKRELEFIYTTHTRQRQRQCNYYRVFGINFISFFSKPLPSIKREGGETYVWDYEGMTHFKYTNFCYPYFKNLSLLL